MLGVVGLLTGWALLLPMFVLVYLRLGLPYMDWMAPPLGIAASAPMLGFCTLGGILMMAWSIGKLTKREDF